MGQGGMGEHVWGGRREGGEVKEEGQEGGEGEREMEGARRARGEQRTNQRPHTPNRVSYGRLGGTQSPSFKPHDTNTLPVHPRKD